MALRAYLLHVCRLIFPIVPETRMFGLKATLLRLAGAYVAKGARVCSSVRVLGGGSLDIGERTWIGHYTLICATARVRIGADVDIGPRVYIGTGTHMLDASGPRSAGEGRNLEVIIEDGAWVGAGAIVLPGVRIGRKAVVAAGAVVTQDVPERTVVAGTPALRIRDL